MGFTYGIKLPGNDKKIWAREITSKLYRDLVKSLYNNDTTEFLQHLTYVIEHVSPGIFQDYLNVVEKVLILLHTRSICISPDLKLKASCPTTKKDFEITIRIEDLIEKLEKATYKSIVTHENIQITHSVVKAKDEFYFVDLAAEKFFSYQLASSIDSVVVDNKHLFFKELSFNERVEIVEKLPVIISKKIFDSITSIEKNLSEIKLLKIDSPFTKEVVIDFPVSTDTKVLLEFCKLIFNDDLGNLYRITFNLVNKGNFTPEYVDGITPAEQLLYWTYFVQQAKKEQDQYDSAAKGKSSTSSYGGQQLKGIESPSEFT